MAPCAPGTGYSEPFEVTLAPAKLEMHVSELIPQAIYIVPTPEARRRADWDSLWLRLELPSGFRMPSGSLVLGMDTLQTSGGTGEIEAALPSLRADSTYCLRYLVGSNRKTAQGRFAVGARIRRGASWLSDRAEGTIEVLDAPLFHRSVLVGCVFQDLDADGARQEDEPGLAGARVTTRDGLEAWTDERGEFALDAGHGGKLLAELELPDDEEAPRIVLGGRHRLVTLVPGVPERVAFPVVSLAGPGGEAPEPGGADPCASLRAWDRRLWGGFFVLDRQDDRQRLDLVRACVTADMQPALVRSEPEIAAPRAKEAGSAPAQLPGAAAGRVGAVRSPAPPPHGPPPASAPARAPRSGRFRTGLLRAVEAPEPGTPPAAPVRSAPELPPATPRAAPADPAPGTGTIEIGEKMFLPGTARLTGEYARMFEALGRSLAIQGLAVNLRSAAPLRRDEPADRTVDRRRIAAVEEVLASARAAASDSLHAARTEAEVREKFGPRDALREARIEETAGELRLVLTFTGRVEYAWGTRPGEESERATLCLLGTGIDEAFVMPYLPRRSPLRGLAMDAHAQTGSVLVHIEPAPGLRPYLETLGDPFRLVVRIARSSESAR